MAVNTIRLQPDRLILMTQKSAKATHPRTRPGHSHEYNAYTKAPSAVRHNKVKSANNPYFPRVTLYLLYAHTAPSFYSRRGLATTTYHLPSRFLAVKGNMGNGRSQQDFPKDTGKFKTMGDSELKMALENIDNILVDKEDLRSGELELYTRIVKNTTFRQIKLFNFDCSNEQRTEILDALIENPEPLWTFRKILQSPIVYRNRRKRTMSLQKYGSLQHDAHRLSMCIAVNRTECLVIENSVVGAAVLGKILSPSCHITAIDLSDSVLTTEAALVLKGFLTKSSPKKVVLRNCHLEEDGTEKIVAGVDESNDKMELLDLRGNELGAHAAKVLVLGGVRENKIFCLYVSCKLFEDQIRKKCKNAVFKLRSEPQKCLEICIMSTKIYIDDCITSTKKCAIAPCPPSSVAADKSPAHCSKKRPGEQLGRPKQEIQKRWYFMSVVTDGLQALRCDVYVVSKADRKPESPASNVPLREMGIELIVDDDHRVSLECDTVRVRTAPRICDEKRVSEAGFVTYRFQLGSPVPKGITELNLELTIEEKKDGGECMVYEPFTVSWPFPQPGHTLPRGSSAKGNTVKVLGDASVSISSKKEAIGVNYENASPGPLTLQGPTNVHAGDKT